MTNADIDALSSEDFYKEFRSIWKGTEIKLTDEVSMFSRGKGQVSLFVISSIHGEERAGIIALYRFAQKLTNLKFKGKICLIPIINSKAWNLRRRSVSNQNLNFVWNDKRAIKHPQIKKTMQILKKNPPLFFLDLHEDPNWPKHYICRHVESKWGLHMQKSLLVSTRSGTWKKHDNQSAESYVHSLGVENSFTVESSMINHHIDERVEFHLQCLNFCLKATQNEKNMLKM